MLRSFDQFANLVLEGTVERVFVGEQYGDIPLGLQLIRGENVVGAGGVSPMWFFSRGCEHGMSGG